MMTEPTDLIPIPSSDLIPRDALDDQVDAYADASRSTNTKHAYRRDWRDFTAWCADQGCDSLPAAPYTITRYITALGHAGRKISTIERRLSSISQAHKLAGYITPPTQHESVRTVMSGIRRTHRAEQSQAAPMMIETLRILVATLPDSLLGVRDRALLLVGFAGAFRRSELVAIQVSDVSFVTDGIVIHIPRSKTDQDGKGIDRAIPYGKRQETCPIRALRAWLRAASITEGPIFRPLDRWGHVQDAQLSDRAVARIVQRTVAAAGLDPEPFSGHSLRAGFITSAVEAGLSEGDIMRQSGHRSVAVMRGYVRRGSLFKDNVAGKVGL